MCHMGIVYTSTLFAFFWCLVVIRTYLSIVAHHAMNQLSTYQGISEIAQAFLLWANCKGLAPPQNWQASFRAPDDGCVSLSCNIELIQGPKRATMMHVRGLAMAIRSAMHRWNSGEGWYYIKHQGRGTF